MNKVDFSQLSVLELRVLSDALESYQCELDPDGEEHAVCEGLQSDILAHAPAEVLWGEEG